jgi:putative ABC transport system permease protein
MKHFINSTLYEFKQAYLNLKQKPLFVFSVVSTMGITLGALLCVLTLAYVMLIKPLPYPEQDRLYMAEHNFITDKNIIDFNAFPYPSVMHLYQQQTVFDNTALIAYGEDVLTSLPSQPALHNAYVSAEFFSMLGANFVLGRGFEQTESINTNIPVAILSYSMWQNEFNQNKNILNKTVAFSGTSFRVIGVLDKNFIEPQIHGTGLKTAIWFPWDFNQDKSMSKNWGSVGGNLTIIGKLKANISAQQAEQTLTHLINSAWQKNVTTIEFFQGWHITITIKTLKQIILGDRDKTLYLLIAGILGLVIIALVNISNLFVSRVAEQQQSLAITAALGAKQQQLFKSILLEALLLMLCAATIALIITELGFFVIGHYFQQQLAIVSHLSIQVFTLVLAILSISLITFLFAKLAMKTINYKSLNAQLLSSGKGTGIQISQSLRNALIISQIAITAVLVFSNMSLFKTAVNTINHPLGFNTQNITHLSLSAATAEFPRREEIIPTMKTIINALKTLPQVEAITRSSSPLNIFRPAVFKEVTNNERYQAMRMNASPEYFQMIGQPLQQGRYFSTADFRDQNRVLIVNNILAQQLASHGKVLGAKIKLGDNNIYTVVGIVKGITLPNQQVIPAHFYPLAVPWATQMLIKLKGGQKLSRQQVAQVIKDHSSIWSVFDYQALDITKNKLFFTEIATAITTSVLTVITVFLAAIGLYGILSYSTQMRRFEIGTRMAIGAKRSDLISLIIKDNARAILLGIGISMLLISALVLGFSEQLQSYLTWQLIPLFLITLGLVSLISFAACYLPLRQYINNPAMYSLRGSE